MAFDQSPIFPLPHPAQQGSCLLERALPERRGSRPAPEEGKPVLTTAPKLLNFGDGNTGRLPLRSAVGGVPREARERAAI